MVPRTITSVVTAETIALNAFIYGYAGHSLVTPHGPLQQLWWTESRISSRVTAEFITSRIRPSLRSRLNQGIDGFSELTNSTYLDWILARTRRLFLILAETGIPDKIFNVVDASWDDDDLPIPPEMIVELGLRGDDDDSVKTAHKPGKDKPGGGAGAATGPVAGPAAADSCFDELEASLFSNQFAFLLRELEEGGHIDYAENEIVPLEYVHKMPPAVSLQRWYRVRVANGNVYVRRKFTLRSDRPAANLQSKPENDTKEKKDESRAQFLHDVHLIQNLNHPHVMQIFASYTFQNDAFTLSSFNAQHTLQTFIDHRNPAQIQGLNRTQRHELLLGWLYCLASATTAIHSLGIAHSSIRPSNIVIDGANAIAFSEISSLRSFSQECGGLEAYDYAAPEVVAARALKAAANSSPPAETATFSLGSSTGLATGTKPGRFASKRKYKAPRKGPERSASAASSLSIPFPVPPNHSEYLPGFESSTPRADPDNSTIPQIDCREYNLSVPHSKASDVFSLGCVFLDILSLVLKKRRSEFVKHRHGKNKLKEKSKPRMSIKTDLGTNSEASKSSGRLFLSVPTTPTSGSFSIVSPTVSVPMPVQTPVSSPTPSSAGYRFASSRSLLPAPSTPFPHPPTSLPSSSLLQSKSKMDTSFHANLEHVYCWMDLLEKTAAAFAASSPISDNTGSLNLYSAVRVVLSVCRDMLQIDPARRPAAREVRIRLEQLWEIGYRKVGFCCANSAAFEEEEGSRGLGRSEVSVHEWMQVGEVHQQEWNASEVTEVGAIASQTAGESELKKSASTVASRGETNVILHSSVEKIVVTPPPPSSQPSLSIQLPDQSPVETAVERVKSRKNKGEWYQKKVKKSAKNALGLTGGAKNEEASSSVTTPVANVSTSSTAGSATVTPTLTLRPLPPPLPLTLELSQPFHLSPLAVSRPGAGSIAGTQLSPPPPAAKGALLSSASSLSSSTSSASPSFLTGFTPSPSLSEATSLSTVASILPVAAVEETTPAPAPASPPESPLTSTQVSPISVPALNSSSVLSTTAPPPTSLLSQSPSPLLSSSVSPSPSPSSNVLVDNKKRRGKKLVPDRSWFFFDFGKRKQAAAN